MTKVLITLCSLLDARDCVVLPLQSHSAMACSSGAAQVAEWVIKFLGYNVTRWSCTNGERA